MLSIRDPLFVFDVFDVMSDVDCSQGRRDRGTLVGQAGSWQVSVGVDLVQSVAPIPLSLANTSGAKSGT